MRCARRRGRRTGVLLVCAAVLAATSCDGGEGAGTVESVLNPTAQLNDEPVAGGDAIPYDAVLVTDRSGIADFRLLSGALTCRLLQNSELHVGRHDGMVWDLLAGRTVCQSTARDSGPLVVAAKDRRIEVGRARFVVKVGDDTSVVRNVEGQMDVGDVPLPTKHAIKIPPDPSASVSPPRPFRPEDLPKDILEAMSALEELTAEPEAEQTTPGLEQPTAEPETE